MKVHMEWQDQHHRWHHYQTKHNERDAFRVASNRARSTGQRHRLVDDQKRLLDLGDPLRCKVCTV